MTTRRKPGTSFGGWTAAANKRFGGLNPQPGPAPSAPAPPAAPAPAAPASSSPPADQGQAFNQNAFDVLLSYYTSLGIGPGIAGALLTNVQKGVTDAATMEVLLREDPAFKARFPAIAQRVAAGQNPISVAHYIDLENEYTSILQGAGMPAGFYDKPEDFTKWIAGDVSPDEIRSRVAMAQVAVQNSDPSVRQALGQFYGLGEGDLTAYFLDPNRSRTLFETQRSFNTAQVGAAAIRQGLTTDLQRAQLFADQGVTADQANQAYGTIAAAKPTADKLSSIYGDQYGQTQLEDELLGNSGAAKTAREKLVGKEVANFSGNGSVLRSQRRRGAY